MAVVRTVEGRRKSVRRPDDAGGLLRRKLPHMAEAEVALLRGMVDDAAICAGVAESRWRTPPVPVAQWLEDPYHMGASTRTLYPMVREDLVRIFEGGYKEIINSGGIGVAKTTTAVFVILRVLYELSCMHDPHAIYGLSAGSELLVPVISKNLVLARRVIKSAIDDKIKLSPYFMNEFTPVFRNEETIFPRNIRLAVGSYGSERVLGSNVVAAYLDECFGKNCFLTMRKNGIVHRKSIGELTEEEPLDLDRLEVLALDHAHGESRWTPFRMRASTVQPLVQITAAGGRVVAPSLDHPVLVRRGEWLVYVPAGKVRVGDETTWEVGGASEGAASNRGTTGSVVGDGEKEDGRTEPVLGEAPFGGDQGATARERSVATPSVPIGGSAEEDRGGKPGEGSVSGDASADQRGQQRTHSLCGASAEDFRDAARGVRVRAHREEAAEARSGASQLWAQAYGGDAPADERCTAWATWSCSLGGVTKKDIRGEHACNLRGEAHVPLCGRGTGRGEDPVPEQAGGVGSAGALRHAGRGEDCGGRAGNGDPVPVQWRGSTDDSGLLGGTDGWGEDPCGGEECCISIRGPRAGAPGCVVAVVLSERHADAHCDEQPSDARHLAGAVRYGGVHGVCAKGEGALPLYADGYAHGGCRVECLRVEDLPSGFELSTVQSVVRLPPEQTYSIETGCQTFVADGCVVHNTNFPPGTRKQVITTTAGAKMSEAHFDIVERVYTNLLTRLKSRLVQSGGDTPGMMILTSSAGTLNSFIDRRIRDAADDPQCFVRDHTAWTVKPREHFCGEKFRVLCGTSSIQSRILREDEEPDYNYLEGQNATVIEIPVEFRKDFELNLEDSLRDIAGISTQAISPYIQRVEALEECIRADRAHPWATTRWVANTPSSFQWDLMVKQVRQTTPSGHEERVWQPLRNPSAPRWIHMDLSLSKDSTGFCMAHIGKWVEVHRRGHDGRALVEMAPSYVVDFILKVDPPTGEQIFLADVRELIYELAEHGYRIAGVSSDTFESADMHQIIRRTTGIKTVMQSVDRTTMPYDTLKAAIYEGRLEMYRYDPVLEELRALEYDRERGKVDHPKHSGKDASDGLAGAIYMLATNVAKMPMLMRDVVDVDERPDARAAFQREITGGQLRGAVDPEEVRAQRARMEGTMPVPFLMGD